MLIASFVAAAALATMAPSSAGSIIEVSDVEQLYDAVNEPANAGATIVLAPGLYVLTKVKPGGGTRPNDGRLELQTDMSIYGVTGHPESVVIDSSEPVNGPSFTLEGGLGNGGTIRIGRGRNNVEWLTVVGGSNSAAGVQTDLVGAPAVLRVAHVVSRGSVRGIDVRNLGPAGAGRTIVIDLDANKVFENTAMNGQGIRFVNSSADDATIEARLYNNRSHDNNQGFLASNERSSFASINIDSYDDRFEDDMIGGVIFGGLTTAAGTASCNTVTFTMNAGSIAGQSRLGAAAESYGRPERHRRRLHSARRNGQLCLVERGSRLDLGDEVRRQRARRRGMGSQVADGGPRRYGKRRDGRSVRRQDARWVARARQRAGRSGRRESRDDRRDHERARCALLEAARPTHAPPGVHQAVEPGLGAEPGEGDGGDRSSHASVLRGCGNGRKFHERREVGPR